MTWKEAVRLVDLQKNIILLPSEEVEKKALEKKPEFKR